MQERWAGRQALTAEGLFRRAWLGALPAALFVVVLDQLTKTWAEHHLSGDRVIDIIGPIHFVLVYNTGIAFGLGPGNAKVLVGVALVVMVMVFLSQIGWLGHQPRGRENAEKAGLRPFLGPTAIPAVGLVLGGAAGNVCDRVFRSHGGAVVDFIKVAWFWPVFNVADAAIVVGAIMVVVFGAKPGTAN